MSEVHETLIPHPSTGAGAARAVDVTVRRDAGLLHLRYRLSANFADIRIPEPSGGGFALGLWEHTCFEAFLASAGPAYHELNLSPSGEWAVFAFSAYREIATIDIERAVPRLETRRQPECLELAAVLPLAPLSPEYAVSPLHLGLSAVIEASDGTLAYWSLFHPPGKADFHHADARSLILGAKS